MFSFLVAMILGVEPVALDLGGFTGLALERSPLVQEVTASRMQAEASFITARAALLPKLGLSASRGHTWADMEYDSYTAGFSLTQEIPISAGGASLLSTRAASLGRVQAGFSGEAVLLSLRRSVALAFYDVVEAMMQVSAARDALERSSVVLRRVEVLSENGAATSLDLSGAKVEETGNRLSLLQKEQRYEAAMETLFTVCGIQDGSGFTVDTSRILSPLSRSEVLDLGAPAGRNPSLSADSIGLQRAELNASASARSWLPSYSLSGTVGFSDDELDFGEFADRTTWGVSVNMNWPIFDGFQRSGQTTAARAAVLQAEADLAVAEIESASAARVALDALSASVEGLALADLRLDYARQKADLCGMKYGMGALDLDELLEAQADLSEAEAGRISALTECLRAEVEYLVQNGMSPRVGN
jgi:outer membrane protein